MPQLIGLVLVGAGIWAGLKALRRVAEHAAAEQAERDRAEAATAAREKDLGRLECDPATGVWAPAARMRDD